MPMRITRSITLAALALSLMLLARAPLAAQEAAPPPPVLGAGDALIQPGDQIVLSIWREPDLSGTFTVDAAGTVVLPRLGPLPAASLSGSQLQDTVRQEFTRYLRNPSIQVQVLRRVGVQGEVRDPGLYMVDLTKTLREVISEAGGITEFGNPNRISIMRDGERIPLDEDEGARFVTAELRSGDQVFVGRRSWFEINSLAIVSTAAVVVSVVVPLLRSAF
jgi:polysaccharide biosynthesis/export protein